MTVDRNYTANGLNQYGTAGPASFTYDAKGNLTSDGTNTYTYSSENLMKSASGPLATTLAYDPLLRLYRLASTNTMRFAYDGLDDIAEYDASNGLKRRFVFEPGMDRPIVHFEISNGNRVFLSADERGSIISRSLSDGSMLTINTYDEYGIPGSANDGRFQYTGQSWLTQIGMYYYKARMYSPTLGRFMQTDPIGMGDGPNLYAYVGNDPINFVDPLGLLTRCVRVGKGEWSCSEGNSGSAGGGDPFGGSSTGGYSGLPPGAAGDDPPDTTCAAHPRACAGMTPEEQEEAIVVTPNPTKPNTPWYFNGQVWVPNPQYSATCGNNVIKRNAVPILADALGLIPGKGTAVTVTRLGASTVSGAINAWRGDAQGTALGYAGINVELFGPSGAGRGKEWAKAVPFVGSVVSLISLSQDLYKLGDEFIKCGN